MIGSVKRIAVTGSGGFLGSRLVNRLKEDRHHVLSIDLSDGYNLTNWEQVKDIPPFDAMIHLAGLSFVPESYRSPREFYTTNLLVTLHALELCRIHNARIIYASSYVYGIPKYLPIDEQHPVSAYNPYAQTKLMGEEMCRAYTRDFSVPNVIFRMFNLYGPGQSGSFLIPMIVNQAKTGRIQLRDPKPRRDFVYIDDVVEAYRLAVNYTGNSITLNIGSGESHSVEEIVSLTCLELPECEIIYTGSDRPVDIPDTIADCRLAAEILGWHPQVAFSTGLHSFFTAP
jgi:UDP-glucose 4-epimerase